VGRLKKTRTNLIRHLRRWDLPVIIAIAVIFISHNTFLGASPTPQQMLDYLNAGNQLEVGTEPDEGFLQIYYVFDEEKIFITEAPTMNGQPQSSAEFITYTQVINGQRQVMQYNVLTGTTTQLSSGPVNMAPKIYLNWVVWQSWADEGWHVMFYDGVSTRQISDPAFGSAVRPVVGEDKIRFTQELDGEYTLREYIPSTDLLSEIEPDEGQSVMLPALSE
jgi:hypothetical protein